MPIGELLGYVTGLMNDLGLGSYVIAVAIISIAITLLNRLFDR